MQRSPHEIERKLLRACPQCGYSFTGLASAGTCPECGFPYDERTIVLKGLSRGMKNVPLSRKLMWIWVGLGGTFAPQVIIETIVFGSTAVLTLLVAFGVLWLPPLVYLIATRRGGEAKGVDTFVFAAGGFGSCHEDGDQSLVWQLTDWKRANAVTLERKSANWHRLRLGQSNGARGRMNTVFIDAMVRCDAQDASQVRSILEQRMHEARQHT